LKDVIGSDDFADLMRDVKKIAENKSIFYSHRLNSIMSMSKFYEIFHDNNELREEIMEFLLNTLKKE